MDVLNNVLNFLSDHLVLSVISLGAIIQISPIKIDLKDILVKLLVWIGHQMNQEITEDIDGLKSDFKHEEEKRDNQRIKDLRWSILDFANSLERIVRTEDQFNHIFDIYEEYEDLIKKYKKKNGQVDRAMKKINLKYNEMYGLVHINE